MSSKGKRPPVKEEKTAVINVRVTPKEKEIIERLAERDGVSISQYVRGTVVADMLLTGDADAMKYSLSMIGGGLKEVVRSKLFNQPLPDGVTHEG